MENDVDTIILNIIIHIKWLDATCMDNYTMVQYTCMVKSDFSQIR